MKNLEPLIGPYLKRSQCLDCSNIIPKPEPFCPMCGGMRFRDVMAREVCVMESISPYLCEPVHSHFEIQGGAA